MSSALSSFIQCWGSLRCRALFSCRFQLQTLAEMCARLFGETLDVGSSEVRLPPVFRFGSTCALTADCGRVCVWTDNVEDCLLAALKPGHDLILHGCVLTHAAHSCRLI